MPFTLNGIGTHYYFPKNRSARVDVCQSCKRSATLSSYDTREWFCVLYIPLIPLTKYRILDDCSSCRRHHRLKLADFASQMTAKVAPLREVVRRSPNEPQGYLDLVNALIGWEMRDEAQREIEAVVERFPRNAEVQILAGQLAIDRADWNGALPFFERAQSLAPQNAAAVYGHGWLLHQLGRDDEAIPALQRVLSLGENRSALYLIAISQSRLGRWSEALQNYQRLAMVPGYASDKAFLRRIAECKRQLGYQLTDAERRASRRWWPFGGTKKPKIAKLQSGPVLIRPALRIPALILLVFAAGGGLYYAWERYSHTDLYVDNELGRAVHAELDGAAIDVAAHGHQKESVGKGSHTIVIRENDGRKELERMTFEIPSASIFDALMHDRFFVYNVASSGVYRRATHGYATLAENSTYGEEVIAMQRFFEQRDVDYPFEDAPQTVNMDAGASSEKKISFNAASDVTLAGYAAMRAVEGHTDEAQRAIRQALAIAPCDRGTRMTDIYLASGTAGASSKAARQWTADCGDDIEAHRTYQQIEVTAGRHDAVTQEYRARLDAAPQSAQAHYLFGRLVDDPAVAIAEQTEAARLDPKLVWARVARGYVYQEQERYDDALRELGGALDMEGCDPSVVGFYASTAIAKGNPAEAMAKVDQILARNRKEGVALHARWLLAAAAEDWEGAAKLQKELEPLENPGDAWSRRLQLLRLQGQHAGAAMLMSLAAHNEELRGAYRRAQLNGLLQEREYTAARALLKESAADLNPASIPLLQVYVSGGLIVSGNEADGAELLAEAATALKADPKLAEGQYLAGVLISGLRGTMPVKQVMTITRENSVAQYGWFVAGVLAAAANDRPRASDCFHHAIRATPYLDFPYLETRQMEELVRGKGLLGPHGLIAQAAARRPQ